MTISHSSRAAPPSLASATPYKPIIEASTESVLSFATENNTADMSTQNISSYERENSTIATGLLTTMDQRDTLPLVIIVAIFSGNNFFMCL